jgi:hypothetical protein
MKRMTFDSTGNIVIRTANPTYSLDVNGNVRIAGEFNINNNTSI